MRDDDFGSVMIARIGVDPVRIVERDEPASVRGTT